MKKFFQEIKKDFQFKTAGPGQKLTESARDKAPKDQPPRPSPTPRQGPTDEAQRAAAAALARLEQKQLKPRGSSLQDALQNRVAKELEAEAGSSDASGTCEKPQSPLAGPGALSISGVYFTCPLTGSRLRKDQREAHIREAILQHTSVDPVAASIMKIHTFNKDQALVKLGVETIAKYLDNICLHPEEKKYQKIKLQNKVFQDRISCLEGTNDFFQAVGFEKTTLPVSDEGKGPEEGGEARVCGRWVARRRVTKVLGPADDTMEEFYVLGPDALAHVEALEGHKEQLLHGEPLRAQLDRQRRVLRPSPLATHFDLPEDFYHLTAAELKREQQLRTEALERLAVLRTKAMREKEEQREMKKYVYTLLRVRFPDGYILQGTFYARERVSTLYAFVREALQSDWLPFELLPSGRQKLTDENLAFNECGLVPSALLTFAWDAAILADVQAAGAEQSPGLLKPELLSSAENLS
ncbi:UBX domain-containing protein 6 isoform X1 [Tachyglossus aculeatus]|uniref:UBX domain-containing protein 6 isoform X1 n=1 Tax=Tachyglossus aculeatus TaxID=9261 RepID=UPI0018F64963|nr:UBX domain-containing protein 6 isoform X1 [Tachyglossus aculeatus]